MFGNGWHAGLSGHADPYRRSHGPNALLTLFGAEHGLGGVSGYDVAETTDEDPKRLAAVQQITWGYLRAALFPPGSRLERSVRPTRRRAEPAGTSRLQEQHCRIRRNEMTAARWAGPGSA